MLASCLQFIDMSAYYVLGKEHFTLSFAKHINDNDHLCNKKRVQNGAAMIRRKSGFGENLEPAHTKLSLYYKELV